MGNLEHELLIVQVVNALLDPIVRPILTALGFHPAHGAELIPNYLVISGLVVVFWTVIGLLIKSRLSVDNPSRFQIVLEDLVMALVGLLDEWIGPKGRRFLPLIGALGAFIMLGNYAGLLPGLMSPTSNINVTAGCAVTIWVYYHFHGIKAQGLFAYLKHFALPPGVPVWMAPIMLPIELISHFSRVLSLSLRLFGNIFGEELVILILALLSPWFFPFFPLPMMALGLLTAGLQAFIFVLLSIIYLQGAVAVEHHDEHAHSHGEGHEMEAAELASV
jgi:F-type H+-transporting ATPase subunit a